jgi:hypothetical protein
MGESSRISIDEFVRSRHLLIDRLEFRDDVRLLKSLGVRWDIIASKLDQESPDVGYLPTMNITLSQSHQSNESPATWRL